MIMLNALWAKVWPYIIGAVGIIGGLFFVRQSGKAAGKTEAKIDQLEADQKASERARHVENETAAMADDAVTDELINDWVRHDKRR